MQIGDNENEQKKNIQCILPELLQKMSTQVLPDPSNIFQFLSAGSMFAPKEIISCSIKPTKQLRNLSVDYHLDFSCFKADLFIQTISSSRRSREPWGP